MSHNLVAASLPILFVSLLPEHSTAASQAQAHACCMVPLGLKETIPSQQVMRLCTLSDTTDCPDGPYSSVYLEQVAGAHRGVRTASLQSILSASQSAGVCCTE